MSRSAGTPPAGLRTLLDRYDPSAIDLGGRRARVRLVAGGAAWDVVLDRGVPALGAAAGARPDCVIEASPAVWERLAGDPRAGMEAFRSGRLRIRRDLHLGVGLLAASGPDGPGRLRQHRVRAGRIEHALVEAGEGEPVLLLHGLGATQASMLPTLAALAPAHRAIAVDLPGFGDSSKPIAAVYDARFFATALRELLDALEIERAHLVGNSMGGRVALELGLAEPARVGRLALLAPSLAWRRRRGWAPLLRVVRPELGLLQPSPRRIAEAVVRRVLPAADDHWTAAGIDEFLRAYCTPRGRAAFYASARQIYLEAPGGRRGFWTRLATLEREALFVWGRRDAIVPLAFARHVEAALPAARHLELDCGHVPQLERPRDTHAAVLAHLGD